ncbi:hypothetical protein E0493_21080 [Roseomonas sp. M0104]|uniref:Glycine zipper domain-containing protein n=1 Tax=Teichococcus coralli TaxID=2545983 RepID=A0A845BG31_9PROT|nr:hypothetical protein [Pseudoroseomonas coralli]MXP65848.1 hypothetical protein [Pseudoroseomonas coralli]
MRRILPAFALAGGLLIAGCQNADGTTDWGSTLALGAGAGLATGLLIGSIGDDGDRHHYRRPPPRRGYGYGYGYGRPHGHRGYYGRGW